MTYRTSPFAAYLKQPQTPLADERAEVERAEVQLWAARERLKAAATRHGKNTTNLLAETSFVPRQVAEKWVDNAHARGRDEARAEAAADRFALMNFMRISTGQVALTEAQWEATLDEVKAECARRAARVPTAAEQARAAKYNAAAAMMNGPRLGKIRPRYAGATSRPRH